MPNRMEQFPVQNTVLSSQPFRAERPMNQGRMSALRGGKRYSPVGSERQGRSGRKIAIHIVGGCCQAYPLPVHPKALSQRHGGLNYPVNMLQPTLRNPIRQSLNDDITDRVDAC